MSSVIRGSDNFDSLVHQGLGVNQTWQNVSSSRVNGTIYTNTTGKPIELHIWASSSAAGFFYHRVEVDGLSHYASSYATSGGQANGVTVVVPPSSSYKCVVLTNCGIGSWYELR